MVSLFLQQTMLPSRRSQYSTIGITWQFLKKMHVLLWKRIKDTEKIPIQSEDLLNRNYKGSTMVQIKTSGDNHFFSL